MLIPATRYRGDAYAFVNCVVQRKQSAELAEGAYMAYVADDDVQTRAELLEEFHSVARTVPEESLTVRDIADMLTIAYRAAARTTPEGREGVVHRPARPALRVVR